MPGTFSLPPQVSDPNMHHGTCMTHVSWCMPGCCVCLSVCLSFNRSCPLVASTVQDGLFPYLVQMLNSMGGCVTYDDPWPWPISSGSFGIHLDNRVRSVSSTVLGGFFLYSAQTITIIRGCVACYDFCQNLEIWIFGKLLKIFGLDLENKSTLLDGFFPYLTQMITSMRVCVAYNECLPWPISSRSFGLGLENRIRSIYSSRWIISKFGAKDQ